MQAAGARESLDGVYRSAYGVGGDWQAAVDACLAALDTPSAHGTPGPEHANPGIIANLGIVYVTDHVAPYLPEVIEQLRQACGVQHWCGTVGLGVAAPGLEIFDEAAVSLLLLALPDASFQLLPATGDDLTLPPYVIPWLEKHGGASGLIHADPRTPDLAEMVASLAELYSVDAAGGISASRAEQAQVSGRISMGEHAVLGLSGALFSPSLELIHGLSQGCSPMGPLRQATAADGRMIASIDGRPALTVLAEDVGASLTEDPRHQLKDVHLALPIPGGSSSDYLVRNILGIDPVRGVIAVGEEVEPGQRLQFVRRDATAAAGDLDRMLGELLRRLEGPPRAAVYISCVARGPNLFGPGSRELQRLQAILGDIPLTGFFANGEICNRRLYGYTGILTLFP